jgi:hypothetical protein
LFGINLPEQPSIGNVLHALRVHLGVAEEGRRCGSVGGADTGSWSGAEAVEIKGDRIRRSGL